ERRPPDGTETQGRGRSHRGRSTRDCRPDVADAPALWRCSQADHDPWALIVRWLLRGYAGMHLVRRGTADTCRSCAHALEQATPDDGEARDEGHPVAAPCDARAASAPPRTSAAACLGPHTNRCAGPGPLRKERIDEEDKPDGHRLTRARAAWTWPVSFPLCGHPEGDLAGAAADRLWGRLSGAVAHECIGV